MTDEIQILTDYIKTDLGYDGEIGVDVDLLEERILDSFSIVQMAVFIQGKFDIELDATDLVRENLATLSSMINMINKKRPASGN